MNNPVSGESSASGQGPHIAVGPAAVAIRRPEPWNAWNLARRGRAWLRLARHERGMECGVARQGLAGPGWAGRGKEYGRARLGAARRGLAWQGMWLGGAGQGTARLGTAGRGEARNMARQGTARRGPARQGGARNLGWRNNQQTQTHTEQGTQHKTTLDTCTRKTTQSH